MRNSSWVFVFIIAVLTLFGVFMTVNYLDTSEREEKYMNYFISTEKLIKSIDEDYFYDVMVETDEYSDYITNKEALFNQGAS